MDDKNDIQLHTYTQNPAYLLDEFSRVFVNIVYSVPMNIIGNFPNGKPEFVNPNPDRNALLTDVTVMDEDLEIKNPVNGRIIPYMIQRSAAHTGQQIEGTGEIPDDTKGHETIPWKNLSGAEITRHNGHTTAFTLIYGNTRINVMESRWPRNIDSLGLDANLDGTQFLEVRNFTKPDPAAPDKPAQQHSEGDMHFLRLKYNTGDVFFVRLEKRAHLQKFGGA